MSIKPGAEVQSPLGKQRLDNTGAAIGAARMNPEKAYGAVPLLLKEYIDNGSEDAWQEIRERIDNIHLTISNALEALDREVAFSEDVAKCLDAGQKILFKPNLVMLPTLDPQSHGPALTGVCTPWEFLAALMRWFHDKLGVTYHQMVIGEAGTTTFRLALMASRASGGETVTTEAIMEGKYGNSYGGWGFYFARKYLADCHDLSHTDDPMSGYTDSLQDICLPPGKNTNKLLIYDFNKIAYDLSNSREVPVTGGTNFKTITLHKLIAGGDPGDAQDLRDWPGCYLVNVAKLKIHNIQLFTGAIKNLGIGLYPMLANASREPGKIQWKYALPNLRIPAVKMGAPHYRWLYESDRETGYPICDKDGKYLMIETGGLEASMADSIQAVRGQGIKMLHVVDAIDIGNITHIGPLCKPVPEGFVLAGIDPVALDVCGARYIFSMVPMADVDNIRKQYNITSDVIQKMPIPIVEDKNIISGQGYDSAYSRYVVSQYCQDRGLGQQKFYVMGNDLWQGGSLASLRQRLGRVDNGIFSELLVSTLYHTSNKPLLDLQAASLAYLDSNDQLTGSDFKNKILETFDENGDGIIDYTETGRGNSPYLMALTNSIANQDMDPLKALKLSFLLATTSLKLIKGEWNPYGYNTGEPTMMAQALAKAFAMADAEQETPDPFFPEMTWGKGKWPSLQYAIHQLISTMIYGQMFPARFDIAMSPYGYAFSYADARFNGEKYSNIEARAQNEDIIGNYHKEVASGGYLLPFTLHVPKGLGSTEKGFIPNVEETDNPELVFTASFNGTEVWRDLRLSSFNLK